MRGSTAPGMQSVKKLGAPGANSIPHELSRRDRDGEELFDRDVDGFDLDVGAFDVEGFDRDVDGFEAELEDGVELFFRSEDLKSVRMRLPRLFDRCSGAGVAEDSRGCAGTLDGERRYVVSRRSGSGGRRYSGGDVRARESGATRSRDRSVPG